MKYSIIKVIGVLSIVGLIAFGCDSVVDHHNDNTADIQHQKFGYSFSVESSGVLAPFTQTELDNNWEADRKFPTGGVESVSFDGRENVAKIGVIGEEQDTRGSFYFYEGIKKVADFGNHAQVDLYVPSEWQNADVVNVGFWTSNEPLTAYPLIVYRNSDDVDAGFYTYTYEFDENGNFLEASYELSQVPVNYDGWNTLAVTLDKDNEVALYTINGTESGSITPFGFDIGNNIGQVFLNHYNNGTRSYNAYWHNGNPTNKSECKQGGWEGFGFGNQGQCIRFVNTGKDSR